MTTIPDVLLSHYKNQPDREAFVFAHTDGTRTSVTFREIYENATSMAKSLLNLGVKKSEFILVSLKNCREWLYVVFGAIIAGIRPMNLGFTYTDGRDVVAMANKLETCSAIVLEPYSDDESWNIFRKIVSTFDKEGNVKSDLMPTLKFLICRQKPKGHENALTVSEMLAWKNKDVTLPRVEPHDVALLLQTGGSTGIPKAVVHTNASLTSAVMGFANKHWKGDIKFFNDRTFTWIAGFPTNLISGETRVTKFGYETPPEDEMGFLIDVIRRERCTHLLALPPLINKFLDRQKDLGDDWPINVIRTGGQPLSHWVTRCIGKLCRRLLCVYAGTEFFITCALEVDDPSRYKEYSVGYPVENVKIKVADEKGELVSANQRGHIWIKSDGLLKEYFNDPEKTQARFTVDGWFNTDDVGHMDQEGLLFVEGRASEVILTGSLTVFPAILESVIQNYPGVAQVVCVPVPHEKLYQLICACIILEDGSDVTEEQLRQFCIDIHTDKTRYFTALPSYYLFLDNFPLTSMHKISRRELTRIATERFSP